MKKEDYYALVNYRGKLKYYHIVASSDDDIDGYDTRLRYINYNPKREWNGVWIKNGKEKIVKKFDSNSDIYKYFKSLDKKFDELILEEQIKQCNIYNISNVEPKYYSLGTSYIFSCWKKAVKLTPNPLGIKI
jgi:hypothetical protein